MMEKRHQYDYDWEEKPEPEFADESWGDVYRMNGVNSNYSYGSDALKPR